MELTRALLRFAAARPHVLLAELPGGTAARITVEAELRRRDWPVAVSPAGADLVVLAGPVGATLAPMVGRVWRQVPKPRVFVSVERTTAVGELLDSARRTLAAGGEAWEFLAEEEAEPSEPDSGQHGGHHEEEHDTGNDPQGHDEHGGGHDDEGAENHGGGHEHHHGDGMEMPGGLDMAGRGEDRDGLMLDQLHVPLGPLLPDWPAGLVVYTTLQGDVLQEATVDIVSEHGVHDDFWNEPWHRAAAGVAVTRGAGMRRLVGAYLDSLGRFLAVAGWPDRAVEAGRLRDELLGGAHAEELVPRLRRLARRLRSSRTLRWLTDGLGVLALQRAESAGLGGPALYASRSGGDVTARWLMWLAEVERYLPEIDDATELSPKDTVPQEPTVDLLRAAPALKVLPELLVGSELAGVRLIVASFGPDLAVPSVSATTEVRGA